MRIPFLQLGLGFIISAAIGWAAYKREALSVSGVIGAILTGTAIFGFGGWAWGLLLITFFVLASLLSKYKEATKETLAEKFAKGSRRDLAQALANGGAGALIAIAYWRTGHPILWFAFVGALATVNADTWATELGVLSKRPPRLITTGKPVEVGTSGGVSLQGTLATLAGGAAIGLAGALFLYVESLLRYHPRIFLYPLSCLVYPANCTLLPLIAALAGLAGSLCDSLMGATVQAIYYSTSREKETEKVIDPDGTPNTLLRGWRWLNNDWVNFVSSAVGAMIGAMLWRLFTGGLNWSANFAVFFYLSKFLPLFLYPAGLTCLLLVLALILRRHPQWQTRLIAVALAVLWLGGNRVVTMAVVRPLEWRYVPPPDAGIPQADAIVVLGGGTRSPEYPRPMAEVGEAGDRVLYAGYLYQNGAAPLIVVSGGALPWIGPDSPTEAEAMVDLLMLTGVPRDAIVLEPRARNTYENAMESLKILDDLGIDNIILVTSALHMPRAHGIFARLPLTVIPAPTDYAFTQAEWEFYRQPTLSTQLLNLVPNADSLEVMTRALREYFGIVVYRLRGWL